MRRFLPTGAAVVAVVLSLPVGAPGWQGPPPPPPEEPAGQGPRPDGWVPPPGGVAPVPKPPPEPERRPDPVPPPLPDGRDGFGSGAGPAGAVAAAVAGVAGVAGYLVRRASQCRHAEPGATADGGAR